MANGITYGIKFPFIDSTRGDYLQLTEFQREWASDPLFRLYFLMFLVQIGSYPAFVSISSLEDEEDTSTHRKA